MNDSKLEQGMTNTPASGPENGKPRWFVEILIVCLAAVFFLIGYYLPAASIFRPVLYSVGSACMSVLVKQGLDSLRRNPNVILKKSAKFLTISTYVVLGIVCYLCFFFYTRWRQSIEVPRYREDGMIWDSASSNPADGSRFLNANQFPFYAYSDNEWGLDSTIHWYATSMNSQNARDLRINYQLDPQSSGKEPYVGLTTSLGGPHSGPYDCSRFKGVEIRLNMGQPYDASPIRIYLVLDSQTAGNSRYKIPQQDLTTGWITVTANWNDFKLGPPIDPARVYQFGIQLIGNAGDRPHGTVYFENIRFTK